MPSLILEPETKAARLDNQQPQKLASNCPEFLLCAIFGALLGLSAPGLGQWYLAWFGLVPLLAATFICQSKIRAFARAGVFGLFYNLTYFHWLLFIHPTVWHGLSEQIPFVMNIGTWFITSLHQALIFGAFAVIVKFVPINHGFLPRIRDGRCYYPSLIVVPLLWVLVLNKIGNAHCILGVPWSMLEYSQFKQTQILQICNLIGGIGLGALLVMSNMAIFELATACCKKLFATVGYESSRSRAACCIGAPRTDPTSVHRLSKDNSIVKAACHAGAVVILIAGCLSYGSSRLNRPNTVSESDTLKVSILQGNISKSVNGVSKTQIGLKYLELAKKAPRGYLCIWPEWSFPFYFSTQSKSYEMIASYARRYGQNWLVGTMDETKTGKVYNAACGITDHGKVLNQIYYKRYLVPVGEYIPSLVQMSPLYYLFSTGTPGSDDYASGDQPTTFDFNGKRVAPLICFETISPELVSDSVRAGGQLIANLSDTVWFRSSVMGEQMIAFCVLRAAECDRSFVFSTNIGPSAIIDPKGRITQQGPRGKECVLTDQVPLKSDITLFCRWFR